MVPSSRHTQKKDKVSVAHRKRCPCTNVRGCVQAPVHPLNNTSCNQQFQCKRVFWTKMMIFLLCVRPGLTSVSVGLITPPKKLLQLRWLALLASFARTHTVDDSVQYIEHGENIEDERNTSCCWYKFSELKSRNPRILFNRGNGSQETRRYTGGQDKQRATERKRHKVRAHQSGM